MYCTAMRHKRYKRSSYIYHIRTYAHTHKLRHHNVATSDWQPLRRRRQTQRSNTMIDAGNKQLYYSSTIFINYIHQLFSYDGNILNRIWTNTMIRTHVKGTTWMYLQLYTCFRGIRRGVRRGVRRGEGEEERR